LQDGYTILEGDLAKVSKELEEVHRNENLFAQQVREVSKKYARMRGLAVLLGSFVPKEDLEKFRERIAEKDPALHSALFGEWPQEKNV
jgi:hypothetical protein